MNEQQKKAAEYAEILLAFSRGEKVEGERNGRWELLGTPIWDFNLLKYRIASKPVERWGYCDRKGTYMSSCDTEEQAKNVANDYRGRHFLMREVTE